MPEEFGFPSVRHSATSPNQPVITGRPYTGSSSLPGWLRVSRRRARQAEHELSGCCRRTDVVRQPRTRPRVVPYVRDSSAWSEQALDRHVIVLIAARCCCPRAQTSGIGLPRGHATGGVRDAYARGIPGRIVTQMFVEVLVLARSGHGRIDLAASSLSPVRLLTGLPHRWDLAMFALVRLPSLNERGAVSGLDGLRAAERGASRACE